MLRRPYFWAATALLLGLGTYVTVSAQSPQMRHNHSRHHHHNTHAHARQHRNHVHNQHHHGNSGGILQRLGELLFGTGQRPGHHHMHSRAHSNAHNHAHNHAPARSHTQTNSHTHNHAQQRNHTAAPTPPRPYGSRSYPMHSRSAASKMNGGRTTRPSQHSPSYEDSFEVAGPSFWEGDEADEPPRPPARTRTTAPSTRSRSSGTHSALSGSRSRDSSGPDRLDSYFANEPRRSTSSSGTQTQRAFSSRRRETTTKQPSTTRRKTPAVASTTVADEGSEGALESSRRTRDNTGPPETTPRPFTSRRRPVATPTIDPDELPEVLTPGQVAEKKEEKQEAKQEEKVAEKSAEPKPAEKPAEKVAAPRVAPAAPARLASNALFRHQAPVLSVETYGPRQLIVGREAEYKVILRNSGDESAHDVQLAVAVPAWAELLDLRSTAGNAQRPSRIDPAAGARWTLSKVSGHAQEELTLKLVVRESRPFDLGVQWHTAPLSSQVSVDVREPKLQLAISGPSAVDYGDKVVYELAFANPGTADAENVEVRLLPIDPADAADTHRIGTIAAGARKVVEIELIAKQAGTLAIRAEATADGGLASDVLHQVRVRRADLRVAIAGPRFRYAGTEATYQVRVQNPGDAAARDVELGVMLPPRAKYLSCTGGGTLARDTIQWNLDSLDAGGERTFEVRCELLQPGTNHIEVGAVAAGDLRHKQQTTTEVEALADLVLDVRDPKGPIAVGEKVTYEVNVRNRGTEAAENIEIVAYFSEGIEPTAVEGVRHMISPGKVVIDPVRRLGPAEEVVLKVVAEAESAGNHVFRVEVRCQAPETRLAEQETTRFYGEDRMARKPAERQPLLPSPLEEADGPAGNGPIEPTPAEEPTLAPEPVEEPTPAGEPTPAEDSNILR